ncbi:MAG: crotonobetainyl-CoA--carnitine CoA-transferase [Burkholderiales bacterium]|nr:crotonobetainyl-CoA--carnitine CoA-transferase [Burkholderiales bacterium]
MDTGKHDLVDKPYLKTDFAAAEAKLGEMLREAPIPASELAENSGLFVSPRTVKRQFFFDEIFKHALPVHGVVMQFGVRWGRDLATLHALRTIYEPYNATRLILGFDTFEGFPSVDPRDGESVTSRKGTLNVGEGYYDFLRDAVAQRQILDPLPQVGRIELHKGDAPEILAKYLEAHPETIVALAHFDMDLYEPTRKCLELLSPFLTKGSVLAFDELQSFVFPGETVAVREVFGLGKIRLRRSPLYSGHGSYFVVE